MPGLCVMQVLATCRVKQERQFCHLLSKRKKPFLLCCQLFSKLGKNLWIPQTTGIWYFSSLIWKCKARSLCVSSIWLQGVSAFGPGQSYRHAVRRRLLAWVDSPCGCWTPRSPGLWPWSWHSCWSYRPYSELDRISGDKHRACSHSIFPRKTSRYLPRHWNRRWEPTPGVGCSFRSLPCPCPKLQIGNLLFHCTMRLFTGCRSVLWLVASSLLRQDRDVYFIKAYPP